MHISLQTYKLHHLVWEQFTFYQSGNTPTCIYVRVRQRRNNPNVTLTVAVDCACRHVSFNTTSCKNTRIAAVLPYSGVNMPLNETSSVCARLIFSFELHCSRWNNQHMVKNRYMIYRMWYDRLLVSSVDLFLSGELVCFFHRFLNNPKTCSCLVYGFTHTSCLDRICVGIYPLPTDWFTCHVTVFVDWL